MGQVGCRQGSIGNNHCEQHRTSDASMSGMVQCSAKIVSLKLNMLSFQSDKSVKSRLSYQMCKQTCLIESEKAAPANQADRSIQE